MKKCLLTLWGRILYWKQKAYAGIKTRRSDERVQREVRMRDLYSMYRWIVAYKAGHNGNSPGFREIMRACNLSSTSVVRADLRRLEHAGLIRVIEGRPHSLEIVGGRWVPPERE